MNYRLIPPSIIMLGNEEVASSWIGFAHSRLRELKSQLRFQNILRGNSIIRTKSGVIIECRVMFGLSSIIITASSVAEGVSTVQVSSDSTLYKVKFSAAPFSAAVKSELDSGALAYISTEMEDGFDIDLLNLTTDTRLIGRVCFVAVTADYNPVLSAGRVPPTADQLYALGEIRRIGSSANSVYVYNSGSDPYLSSSNPSADDLFFDEDSGCFCLSLPAGIEVGSNVVNKLGKDLYIDPSTGKVAVWAFIRVGTTGYLPSQSGSVYDPLWYFGLSEACSLSKRNDNADFDAVSIPFMGFAVNSNYLESDNFTVYDVYDNFPNRVYGWNTFDMLVPGDSWENNMKFSLYDYGSSTGEVGCDTVTIGRFQTVSHSGILGTIRVYVSFARHTLNWHDIPSSNGDTRGWWLITNIPVRKSIEFQVGMAIQSRLGLDSSSNCVLAGPYAGSIINRVVNDLTSFDVTEGAHVFTKDSRNLFMVLRAEMVLGVDGLEPFSGDGATTKVSDLLYAEEDTTLT